LDGWSGGGCGVFIAPNHQFNHWGRLLSMGAPDSPVRHRTVSGAPATSPNRRVLTVLTVGALSSCGTGQSGATPDRYCALSGAPLAVALTFACTVHVASNHWSRPLCWLAVAPLAHRTVRWHTGQSGEL
jgi:hypothetical protein